MAADVPRCLCRQTTGPTRVGHTVGKIPRHESRGKGRDEGLEREDKEWLIEYLDNVRALIAMYLLPLNLL